MRPDIDFRPVGFFTVGRGKAPIRSEEFKEFGDREKGGVGWAAVRFGDLPSAFTTGAPPLVLSTNLRFSLVFK